MVASKLPILPLVYPIILLPGSRQTIPVPRDVGGVLQELIEQSDSLPVVAAVPVAAFPTPESSAPMMSDWGTSTRIMRIIRPTARNPRQPYLVFLQSLSRVRLVTPFTGELLSPHDIEYPETDQLPAQEVIDKFKINAHRLLNRLAKDTPHAAKKEGYAKMAGILDDISDNRTPWFADVLVDTVDTEYADKLAILSTPDPSERLTLASEIFVKQASLSEVNHKLDETYSKEAKKMILLQKLAVINQELQSLRSSPSDGRSGGELDDDEQNDADDLADVKKKIEAMAHGSEERKIGVREWRRLKRIPQGSAENGVIRTYLEWITALPWSSTVPASMSDSLSATTKSFLAAARSQLDADHYGLEKIKKRLIEYLAVVRLKEIQEAGTQNAGASPTSEDNTVLGPAKSNVLVPYEPEKATNKSPEKMKKRNMKGPILLFVGPPGTGKTSLGQSIAKALDRPFQRISLGGVRDEAEIRGHRRTYVASGPGVIVQALRKAGRRDPVLLLDEIDKVGTSNFHGDPSAALLEVLDPEQNHSFNDHYINIPIDLSQVLFICTANSLDTISAPLLDRCEIIQLAGYTYDEKLHIARRHLIPKQIDANGLNVSQITITEPALLKIVTHYTREAGVRSLERAIGGVIRAKAVEWAESSDTSQGDVNVAALSSGHLVYSSIVEEHDLERILGISRWDGDERDREERRGIVYGLVVMGQGEGGILAVESIMVPGTGQLKLTGSLGDVIKESGELALSWVKRHAYELCITNAPSQDPLKVPEVVDIHLHLPAGAQKKDGPSAGVAMVCAFVSLLTGACVPTNIAMTGEITLRGRVTPVGGIKEKVLGAHRAQMSKVILPWANRKDVEHDVALEIRNEMKFVFVKTVREALEAAFGPRALAWRRELVLESRL